MSKKKKSYKYIGGTDVKKSKKKSKKGSYYKEPKLKKIKPTVGDKAAKKQLKLLQEEIKIPKKFIETRESCNHACETLSVADYKALTPNWAAYTPALDLLCCKYGEENVAICSKCFEALVISDAPGVTEINDAVAIITAAANNIVRRVKLDDKEVKEINGISKDIADILKPLIKLTAKASAKGELNDDSSSVGISNNINLNSNPVII